MRNCDCDGISVWCASPAVSKLASADSGSTRFFESGCLRTGLCCSSAIGKSLRLAAWMEKGHQRQRGYYFLSQQVGRRFSSLNFERRHHRGYGYSLYLALVTTPSYSRIERGPPIAKVIIAHAVERSIGLYFRTRKHSLNALTANNDNNGNAAYINVFIGQIEYFWIYQLKQIYARDLVENKIIIVFALRSSSTINLQPLLFLFEFLHQLFLPLYSCKLEEFHRRLGIIHRIMRFSFFLNN